MTGTLWNPRPNGDNKTKKKPKKSKATKNKPKDDSKGSAGEKAETQAGNEHAEGKDDVASTEAEAAESVETVS